MDKPVIKPVIGIGFHIGQTLWNRTNSETMMKRKSMLAAVLLATALAAPRREPSAPLGAFFRPFRPGKGEGICFSNAGFEYMPSG